MNLHDIDVETAGELLATRYALRQQLGFMKTAQGSFLETGRLALDRPATAIDSDREGVVVATDSTLHLVSAGDEGALSGTTRGSATEVHDLAVGGGGRVFTVDASGRVLEHIAGGSGDARELAPSQERAPEGQLWRLRATRDLLVRAGADLAVLIVPDEAAGEP